MGALSSPVKGFSHPVLRNEPNFSAFWDAMLWAAARHVGVRYLLTEDLQDGFELDRVQFINPFRRANDQLTDEILPQ